MFKPAWRPLIAFVMVIVACTVRAGDRPNVVLITLDDLNWDSVGAYGSPVANVTPNMDRLAAEGLRFADAHVTVAICQPSRAVWMTGRYPHNSGATGFNEINADVPTLVETLKAEGFTTGILGKTEHVVPSRSGAWDFSIDRGRLSNGRSPDLYEQYSRYFLERTQKAGEPFFLMVNFHDPHRPFAGSRQEQSMADREFERWGAVFPPEPDNPYQPEDIVVPGFLPKLPNIEREIAQYFTSVRRADEGVGRILALLDELDLGDNTLVMLLSDNGMPLPFAKTNVYLHSTRTPWIVRWPGKVKANTVDSEHRVSGVDLMPTVLDALGVEPVPGVDGQSFVPVLRGERQPGFEDVYTFIGEIAGDRAYPMRAIQDGKYGYIFNAWPDGKREFRNESQSGLTFAAMRRAAKTDPAIRARVDFFVYRTREEFYDYANDPDARNNLANDPAYSEQLAQYRQRLLARMRDNGDPLADDFASFADQSK